jgi:hypothetical protein
LARRQVLPLAPGDAGDASVRRIIFGSGERVSFDELGPIVVHADCTLRRINNWGIMMKHERAATQRRVAARNAERLAACREMQAAGLLADADAAELEQAAAEATAAPPVEEAEREARDEL